MSAHVDIQMSSPFKREVLMPSPLPLGVPGTVGAQSWQRTSPS